MIKLHLQDGRIMEFEPGVRGFSVARSVSDELYGGATCMKVNGALFGLDHPIEEDGDVEFFTFQQDVGKLPFRHTASHVLAQAVKRLYPAAKLAIGPAVADGFYYDFDVETAFAPEILEKIEAEMKKIIKEKQPVERFVLSREEALRYAQEANEPYKVELIQDLPEGEEISFYRQGEFTDLCAGPHLINTGRLRHNAVKLTSCTGAYWRGDSKNKMLQRIYGTAFPTKEELESHLERIEEAKRRDHRKLGRELGLFMFADEAPGFPFFLPKGMIIKNLLQNYWRNQHTRAGYHEISTPIILSRALWEQSGHWGHYKDNIYTTQIDEADFAIKPMSCPGGILVYKSEMRSYRDLPLRFGELGIVHRHELSGALHGLMRVRVFTQDDAHIYMTKEQIKDEIKGVVALVDEIYSLFGFNYHVELSTMPDDHMGKAEDWEQATDALRAALVESGKDYVVNEGDGAFYGPKIDFHLEDCLGRTWQCGTIQLDFQMPERFELEYVGADGEKHRPVMIHNAIFGSLERFTGILTEHFGGAFPFWLAPVQVKVMPITDRVKEYAQSITDRLSLEGFRVETDVRNEKIGYKIREAQMQKIPYMLVLGDKEAENGQVTLRTYQDGDQGSMPFDSFVQKIQAEIELKK